MKYKAYLIVLDYPIATTGDVYTPEIIQSAIKASQYKLEHNLLLGCFIDNRDAIRKLKRKDKIDNLDSATAANLEVANIKRNLSYYKLRSDKISHVVKEMYVENDVWVAEIATLPTGAGLKLESYLKDSEMSIKFRPVVTRERADGIVTSVNDVVSIDAVLRSNNGS